MATVDVMIVPTQVTFQSTPPSRVATRAGSRQAPAGMISIHTTLAGGDPCFCVSGAGNPISIHTTLAGGDSKNGREIHPFSIPIKA